MTQILYFEREECFLVEDCNDTWFQKDWYKGNCWKLWIDASCLQFNEERWFFFIAGNGITISSSAGIRTTNHTEGETAIIMGLSRSMLREKGVLVDGSADLFLLLLPSYQKIYCAYLYQNTHLTELFNFLGDGIDSFLTKVKLHK